MSFVQLQLLANTNGVELHFHRSTAACMIDTLVLKACKDKPAVLIVLVRMALHNIEEWLRRQSPHTKSTCEELTVLSALPVARMCSL